MKAKNTDLVLKSNQLVEASYRMDLMEQRLVLAAIVEAREQDILLKEQPVKIEAKRFAALFGIDEADAYRLMKEAKNRLYDRSLNIIDADGSIGSIRWVEGVFYKDGDGFVKLKFSSYVTPYLARLETEYTEYRLGQIGKLTSAHAVRIYELCAQYKKSHQGGREISISDLKQMLCMTDEYPRLDDFKRRVIAPAVKQINEHTDLQVTVENVKTGRTVTGLFFSVSEKTAKPVPTKKKAAKPFKLTREYIEKNNLARRGESWDEAFRRLAEEAGQQRLAD
jgi:plasmid replication initiation protein